LRCHFHRACRRRAGPYETCFDGHFHCQSKAWSGSSKRIPSRIPGSSDPACDGGAIPDASVGRAEPQRRATR
jgi:hypothetical protein